MIQRRPPSADKITEPAVRPAGCGPFLGCGGAAQTAEWNLSRLERLEEIHRKWRDITAGLRSHSLVHRLVPWVLTRPAFTVSDALTGIDAGTFTSMNTAVARLASLGIVEPAGAPGRERLFMAPEIIGLFDSTRDKVR